MKHRPNWPFMFYEQGGRTFINRAPRRSKVEVASEVGEALW